MPPSSRPPIRPTGRPRRARLPSLSWGALLTLAGCAGDATPVAPGGAAPPPTVEAPVPPLPPPPTTTAGPETQPTLVFLQDGETPVAEVARALLAEHAPEAGARRDSVQAFESLRAFTAPLTPAEREALLGDSHVAFSGELPEGSIEQAPASWALDRVDQRALPLSRSAYAPAADGDGVRIYVFDTGIRATHRELAGRVLPGFDAFTRGAASGSDCHGHGTFVASNAAGATLGTAPKASVVDVRVMRCDGTGGSEIVAGVEWVLAQRSANPTVPMVANLSIGFPAQDVVDQLVQRMVAANVAVVVAAGNDGGVACNRSPARLPTALTVGATTPSDARAAFSNFGSCVDLFAPGTEIPGALRDSDTGVGRQQGTSMATPFVAGIAAGYLELFPRATPAQVHAAVVGAATPNVVTDAAGSPNRLAFGASFGGTPIGGSAPSGGVLAAAGTVSCVRRTCNVDGSTSRSATSWTWAFGDGGTATGVRATRTYARDGRYAIQLTVRDAAGATRTDTDTVSVRDAAPTASFTATCTAQRACALAANASTDDGRIARYAWDFGDRTTATGAVPSANKTYAAPGTYTIRLTVTDDAGQTATTTRQVTVGPRPPVAAFTVTCSSARACTFDGRRSTAEGTSITQWQWEFGDATVGTGATATKQYRSAGTFNVRLTIRTADGRSASVTQALVLR